MRGGYRFHGKHNGFEKRKKKRKDWFSSASSVLRSLNSVLFLDPFLFPGFLSLVLGLLEQFPLAFSSA
jgi:hypothetical protein